MTDIALRILLQAQNQASSVIKSVGGDIARLNPAMGGVVIGGLAIAAAVGGIAVASDKMAGDFEQAMLSNVAHAGLAKDQVNNVTAAIMNMAPAVGRSPVQLAEAMYPILSAFSGITNQGAKSALALDTLKLSFQAVAGTTTDGTAVANAAVGTFNALGLATNNAATNAKRMAGLMDIMDLTVQQGNMQWDAYKNVISKLAVSIQGTGIKFTEASSALAVLTNEGYSAQKAQTYLSNMFTTMAIKTDALAKHAKALKISFDEQKYSSMSLADKISYLNQITDGNKQKILALLGGNATALKSFNALSTGLDSYKSNLKGLQNAHGALASSFATASQGFNFHLSQMKASFDVLLITIGQQLLPIFDRVVKSITPLITRFAAWLTSSGALKTGIGIVVGAVTGFINIIGTLISIGSSIISFFQQNQWAVDLLVAVLITLAGIALAFAITAVPALVAGFIAWAIAAGAAALATLAAAAPFIIIGLIIAAVVFGIIMAVQHWAQIMTWLKGVLGAIGTWIGHVFSAVGTFFRNIWTGIANFFVGIWNWITSHAKQILAVLFVIITGPIGLIVLFFISHWNQIKSFLAAAWDWIVSKARGLRDGLVSVFTDMWNGIVSVFKGGVNFVIDILNMLIGGLDKMGIDIGPIHIHPNIPKIPHLATGGYVESSGLAMIHQGEQIIPARASSLSGGGGGGGITIGQINVYANTKSDADAIAQRVLEVLSRDLLRSGNLTTWTSGGRT